MVQSDVGSKVIQAMEAADKPQDDLIYLSTGVVLRGKQAPPMTLMSILAAFPRPKVPVTFSKDMGREMENPDDPDYRARIDAWQQEQGSVMLNALIIAGTELVKKPDTLPGPDDNSWVDEYEMLGLPVRRDNKSWRYLRWVQHKAAITPEDIKTIMEVVGRLSGVAEDAVKAAENFPGSDKAAR